MKKKLLWTSLIFVLFGCSEENPWTHHTEVIIPIPSDSTAVFSEWIDLTDGTQQFRNVEVIGTITFAVNPAADSGSVSKRTAARRYNVFINTDMRFRRSQDYTIDQSWTAGGKSGDILMIDEGETIQLWKSYRIWSIPVEVYINIIYGVTTSRVDLLVLWVSYEPLN